MPKTATTEPQDSTTRVTPAPYLPFLTFQGALAALEHGVPKRLDRTMWPSQSGLVQSQILMAFRFFDLVNDQDQPTDLLHEIVDAKDNRAPIIANMVNKSYAEIVAHDLTKMTPKMLEDEMERYHVSGETKRKAVTFFLRAAKFAGLPMHPLLSAMVRNTGPRGKRKGKRLFVPEMNGRADTSYDAADRKASAKTVRLGNGGTVSLTISADPFTLPAEDRQFVFELVDKLQGYADAHPATQTDEDDEEDTEE